MILPSDKVQLSIIDAYSPPGLDSHGNELTVIVLDRGYKGLFRNNLDGLTHSLSEMG